MERLPVRQLDACAVAELPDEIDLANCAAIGIQLLAALDRGVSGLILDMTGTSFCDSSGLNAIIRTHRHARARGAWLRLAVSSRQVRKILAVTSLDTVLPVHASVDEARAAVPPSTWTTGRGAVKKERASTGTRAWQAG